MHCELSFIFLHVFDFVLDPVRYVKDLWSLHKAIYPAYQSECHCIKIGCDLAVVRSWSVLSSSRLILSYSAKQCYKVCLK